MRTRTKLLLYPLALLIAFKAGMKLDHATSMEALGADAIPGCRYSQNWLRTWPRFNLTVPDADVLEL